MRNPAEARAQALAMTGDFGAEALELNRRLVEVNPADTPSRTRLARCYLQAGRLDEAEAEYREALRLEPRNRIAAGGLEMIEQRRRPAPVAARSARPARAARLPGVARRQPREERSLAATTLGPVPQVFAGFRAPEFDELATCPHNEIQARFAPRVLDLVRRVNALPSSVDAAGIREPGKRQLFRTGRGDVHAAPAHWHVFNMGGRAEAQFNIGMYAGRAAGNWLRVGIGFDLSPDPADGANGGGAAVDQFRRFQAILASPRRSLFLGWMVKEEGHIEHRQCGPRLDLREPAQAASLVASCDPGRARWLFFGKWLSPDRPEDAAVLADPVRLVRTIDRSFAGLVPIWRALWE